jgi:hypothetical protein
MLSWVNGLKSISQHRNTCALSVYRSTVCHAINSRARPLVIVTPHAASFSQNNRPQRSPYQECCLLPTTATWNERRHGISCDKKHPRIILNRTELWRVMLAVGNHKMVVRLFKPTQRFFQRQIRKG